MLAGSIEPAVAEPTATAPSLSDISVSARAQVAVIAWQGPAGDTYRVDIDQDADFSSPELERVTTATLVVASDLTPSTGYHVRVALADGSSGSLVTSFQTTAALPAVPQPLLSAAATTATEFRASLTPFVDEVTYEVELARDATFADPIRRTVTSPDLVFDRLAAATTYYARVRVAATPGTQAGDWSAVVEQTTAAVSPLVVGTFNVGCYLCSGAHLPKWEKRRDAVAERINAEAPDVLGLEELAHSRVRGSGTPQVNDLMNRLAAQYATTTCGTRNSPVCTTARNEVHIVYNTRTIEVLDSGLLKLPTSKGAGVRRWMAWAVLKQKSTGKRFVFGAIHLRVGSKWASLRVRQAKAAVEVLRSHGMGNLPAVLVGDFNSNRHAPGGNPPYRVMTGSGLVDPLGRGVGGKDIVEKEVHTKYNSYNRYSRRPPHSGTNIDYIFTTPMRVSEYEVCVRLDSSGRVVGTIPSDHHMLKATVWLK